MDAHEVLGGRATFTLDGGIVDAPPGTLVHVGDPGAKLKAVGAGAGTTVLAIGATQVSRRERRWIDGGAA